MNSHNFLITLVRHGQTAANKACIIQGNADVPLSDVGRSQATKLANHLNGQNISYDWVYSSDLSRALETAQLVTGDKQPIQTDKRLRERAFGVIEGKSLEVYRQEARKAGFKEKELSYYTPEGGETLPQVNHRAKDFFWVELVQKVRGGKTKNILIVTHGGVIREFMRFFRDECKCDFRGYEIMQVTPNTGVNTFELTLINTQVKAKVIKIHDCSHLEENGPKKSSEQANNNDSNCSDNNKQKDGSAPLVAL